MDKVTIRRARPEDKETALRINEDVFAGRDYLPAYYDHFLASPDMFPAVMLFENRIVSLFFVIRFCIGLNNVHSSRYHDMFFSCIKKNCRGDTKIICFLFLDGNTSTH